MPAPTYIAYNAADVTTAAITPVATGVAIKTMLQILTPATAPIIRVRGWGISFNGAALSAPGVVELVETDVAATITAYVAADLQPYNNANAPTSQVQIGTTAKSGYTASAEGTTTASRIADVQQIDPVNQYSFWWPLDQEFECKPGKFLRVRCTFGTTTSAVCWVIWQEG